MDMCNVDCVLVFYSEVLGEGVKWCCVLHFA